MPNRDAFAYESNAHLLREFLVPEPFSTQEWDSLVESWTSAGQPDSFLKWLILQEVIDEVILLQYLSMACGAEILDPAISIGPGPVCPETGLLRNLGLCPIYRINGINLVTGGPELAPDLHQYLGTGAENWKWVLVSPLWDKQGDTNPGRANPASGGELEQYLLGLWTGGVTDIHFERTGDSLRIRVHESGSMKTIDTWFGETVEASLRLLKTWAGMSTAIDSLPQDGRIALEVSGQSASLRASHISTVNGESMVLRNLEQACLQMDIGELGIPSELRFALVDKVLNEPGLIIFSGPTGSGKSTTAYALLDQLRGQNKKILTIEDPIEHELPHAVQSDVNLDAGWTFNQAVRAYLRQDPDIIFLGEMRDEVSAKSALRAALTGHCVLATLHARSNPEAVKRLIEWKIPQGILNETIRLSVNQRLVQDHQSGRRKAEFTWETNPSKRPQAV